MDHSAHHRSLWQELDALVLAEVEALDTRSPSAGAAREPETPTTAPEAPVEVRAEEEAQPPNLPMFDGEEQEVIARTSAWLRDRPNRDMIIDALWSAVAAPSESGTPETAAGELPETSESEPADVS